MAEPKIVTTLGDKPATIRRTPDYKTYYTNQSRMRLSATEVQIFFGILTDEPPGSETNFNDEMMSVILPPQHAKILARGLATAIEAHELQFGEIKLPENLQRFIESTNAQIMDFVKQQVLAKATKPAE